MTINAFTHALALAQDEVRASIRVIEERHREELEAKDRQIQELTKDRRRDELRRSLVIAKVCHELHICHLKRIYGSYYILSRDIKSMLSMDDIPEDRRADLEKEMAVAEAKLHEVQAEMEKEELEFDELVKPLNDELEALN